jgi:hypothetical protein
MSIRLSFFIQPTFIKDVLNQTRQFSPIALKTSKADSFHSLPGDSPKSPKQVDFSGRLINNNLILLPPRKSGIILNGSSGGTIDMIVSPEGAHFLGNGNVSMLAQSKEAAAHEHFNMFNQPVDSSNIDRQHQKELTTNLVNQMTALNRSNGSKVSGMVLTHGTDTIMETAALLSYQRPKIPVVITGAWVSAGKPGSDAIQNIQRAKLLASTLHVPGVFVVIGNDIHLGSQINKVRSGPLSPPRFNLNGPLNKAQAEQPYFTSLNEQPIGHFDPKGQIFMDYAQLQALNNCHSQQPDYLKRQVSSPIHPAYVEHLVINDKTPYKVFEDLFKRLSQEAKPNGAVLEGEWAYHPEQAKIAALLEKSRDNEMYAITTSQRTGLFNNTEIPPIHLRAKLAALLGSQQPDVIKNLPELLRQNLTGEVLGTDLAQKTWFQLPLKPVKPREVLLVTPSFSATELKDASQRLLSHPSKAKPKLLLVGFGDGHVPIGSFTLEDRIIHNLRLKKPALAKSLQKAMQSKTGIEADWTVANAHSTLTSIVGNPEKTKEHLKECLKLSHPNLAAIDEAINKGIDVRMDTKVSNSPATLKSYEIGTILSYLGVKPI